jgi:hypothetical protein
MSVNSTEELTRFWGVSGETLIHVSIRQNDLSPSFPNKYQVYEEFSCALAIIQVKT